MTEAEEIALSIYQKNEYRWPVTYRQAEGIANFYLSETAEKQMIDNVIDALMEFNTK